MGLLTTGFIRQIPGVALADVQAVYSGPEGRLWELLMGEQIHIGGLSSSMQLAERAGIGQGSVGVDLCCCTGAGMRFLVRYRGANQMIGVDATPSIVERGRWRCADEGLAQKIQFVLAEATNSGVPDGAADFVWGEDAWCYVADKSMLIAEAARIVRVGGTIAFTDWVEGPNRMTDTQAERFMRFIKFPTLQTLDGYATDLRSLGCTILAAEDTGRFLPCIDLCLEMLQMQLGYDALKIIGFDQRRMRALESEMRFVQRLAREGKIIQGLFVARKP
jgi:SAM-dependent methyltransferase